MKRFRPVSYTHLDVYKRQLVLLVLLLQSVDFISTFLDGRFPQITDFAVLKRGVREVQQLAADAQGLYASAKTKVAATKKIIDRAGDLPTLPFF